jgi:malate synthase
MNQDEINRVEQACIRLGYNHDQISFIVAVIRNHVEPVRQQLAASQAREEAYRVSLVKVCAKLAAKEEEIGRLRAAYTQWENAIAHDNVALCEAFKESK